MNKDERVVLEQWRKRHENRSTDGKSNKYTERNHMNAKSEKINSNININIFKNYRNLHYLDGFHVLEKMLLKLISES